MTFWNLKPEVPGELGPRTVLDRSGVRPRANKLHLVLQGWLGDDLLTAYPCFVITDRVALALEGAALSRWELRPLEMELGDEFLELHPDKQVPGLHWLVPLGDAGKDDLAIHDGLLIVSDVGLRFFQQFQLSDCEILPYAATTSSPVPT